MVIKTWPTTKVGLVHKRDRETQAHGKEYNMFFFGERTLYCTYLLMMRDVRMRKQLKTEGIMSWMVDW